MLQNLTAEIELESIYRTVCLQKLPLDLNAVSASQPTVNSICSFVRSTNECFKQSFQYSW